MEKEIQVGDWLLGQYQIKEKLGQGAMGCVYKAWHKTSGIDVAIKMVPPEVSRVPLEMEEIKENFKEVQGLKHPNIAAVNHLEKIENADGTAEYFLVMEYVPGETLDVYRRSFDGGKIPVEKASRIAGQIAAGLDYAHKKRVMHRDIKPENIMITPSGEVKILDFGLAMQIRNTATRLSNAPKYSLAGTYPYMAPEQYLGREQDGRTDIYSLGVVFYEMAVGRLPLFSPDFQIQMNLVLKQPPLPIPEAGGCVNKAISKALAKDRKQRYRKAGEFAAALNDCLHRRKRRAPLVAAVAVLVLLVFGGLFLYQRQVEAERKKADLATQAELRKIMDELTVEDIVGHDLKTPSETAAARMTLALMKSVYDKNRKLLLAVDDPAHFQSNEACDELSIPLRQMISTGIDKINDKMKKTAFVWAAILPKQLKPLRDESLNLVTDKMMPDLDVWKFMERGGVLIRSNWQDKGDHVVLQLNASYFSEIPGKEAFEMLSAGSQRGAIPKSDWESGQLDCLDESGGPWVRRVEPALHGGMKPESEPSDAELEKPAVSTPDNESLANRKEAEERFGKIVSYFQEDDLDAARRDLEQYGEFLETHLEDGDEKSRARGLASFFRFYREAESAAEERPATRESLARAVSGYEKAERALEGLPGADTARARVSKLSWETLSAKSRIEDAEKVYGEIVALANGENREKARSVLAENKSALAETLNKEKYGHLEELEKFWNRMDKGEKLASASDKDSLNKAEKEFAEAKRIAGLLPSTIVLSKSVQARMDEVAGKRAALEREEEAKRRAELEREKKEREASQATSTARFVKQADGTVLDRDNNLVWYHKDNGEDITHDEAVKAVARMGGNWRLPTIAELKTLYDGNASPRKTQCGWDVRMATDLIQVTCSWFWASDTSGSSVDFVSLDIGYGGFRHPSNSDNTRALPVRGGN